jgi:hypothetical protein
VAGQTATPKLERKIVRLAQQIGCEARGGIPLGKDYAEIPSWPEWRKRAWEEIVVRYARKNRERVDREIEGSLR